MELWHGPTHAFKDVALTTLPHLLTAAKEITGVTSSTLILVATSGDTGKAALEGFKDVPGTRIAVLYPSDGVSPMQKLQMTTQDGGNVQVYGIEGNFDDAQTAVKKIFTDEAFRAELKKENVELSSANSINLGRLLPQVVYYFSAYFDLAAAEQIRFGEIVNFCVPTGNFGDILAGYYAKRMGLPVGRLLCASNENNVLTDFLSDGRYVAEREFFKTMSPSMDILISSNLERLLFEATGRDPERVKAYMARLADEKEYTVSEEELDFIQDSFFGECATEEETSATIADYFDDRGYIMDPHTAVAACCYDNVFEELTGKTVILSTASPYKFVDDVLRAIGEETGKTTDESLKKLEAATALEIPDSIAELTRLPVRFCEILPSGKIASAISAYALGKTAE